MILTPVVAVPHTWQLLLVPFVRDYYYNAPSLVVPTNKLPSSRDGCWPTPRQERRNPHTQLRCLCVHDSARYPTHPIEVCVHMWLCKFFAPIHPYTLPLRRAGCWSPPGQEFSPSTHLVEVIANALFQPPAQSVMWQEKMMNFPTWLIWKN